MNSITSKIIKIGNSQGVRIPKALLKQSGLEGDVELIVDEDAIVIRKAEKTREGWDEAFKAANAGNEESLWGEEWVGNDFDREE